MARQQSLLGETVTLEGFLYRPEFVSEEEEAELLDRIRALEFHEMKMRGVTARRRVIQYGWNYSFENSRMTEGAPLPDFLLPLHQRAAAFAKVEPADLSEGLLMEYLARPSAGTVTPNHSASSLACRCCRRHGSGSVAERCARGRRPKCRSRRAPHTFSRVLRAANGNTAFLR